jgi:integrase
VETDVRGRAGLTPPAFALPDPGTTQGDGASVFAESLRQRIIRNLPDVTVQFSRAKFPSLSDLDCLLPYLCQRGASAFQLRVLLQKPVSSTLVEQADGRPLELQPTEPWLTLDQLAAFVQTDILPSSLEEETRRDYFAMHRAFVTFAVAHDRVFDTYPAAKQLLHAFLAALVCCRYAPRTIASFLACITTRHHQFGLKPPFAFKEPSLLVKGLKRHVGSAMRQKFPVTSEYVRKIMATHAFKLIQVRDSTMICIGTISAMRVSELVGLDVCDVFWDFDGKGTGIVLYIRNRKQTGCDGGHMVRIAYHSSRSFDPSVCPLSLLRRWLHSAGLSVHPLCRRQATPSERTAPCLLCGPLFRPCPFGTRVKWGRVSRETVQEAISSCLARIGVDTTGFSTKSLRRGGLSSAKSGGVPPALRKLQSGHTSDSYKTYEHAGPDGPPDGRGPLQELRTGWSTQDLYRFSQVFL